MRKESHPCFQTTFQNLPNLIIWHFLHPNRMWNTKSAVDSNLNLCCSELIVAQEFLSQSLAKSGLAFHSFRRIKNTRHFWKSTNKHLISFFEVCKSNYFCPRETFFFFFKSYILHQHVCSLELATPWTKNGIKTGRAMKEKKTWREDDGIMLDRSQGKRENEKESKRVWATKRWRTQREKVRQMIKQMRSRTAGTNLT